MDPLTDVKGQLEEHRAQLGRSNAELYRHLALYLQVLRSGLLQAVQQASFHLATQVDPHRYSTLAPTQRQQLHRRLVSLVGRTSSLLTVEQLAQLAGQMEQQRRSRHQEEQKRLFEALAGESTTDHSDPSPPSRHQAQRSLPSTGSSAADGSIHLGMALPLTPGVLTSEGFPGFLAAPGRSRDHDPDPTTWETAGLGGRPDNSEQLDSEQRQAVEDLVAAFGEALAQSMEPPGPQDDQARPSSQLPWDGAQLPTDPPTLIIWLDGFEQALVRRLRNLSHAINVELLRLGVKGSLLPVSLLEAVLNGQLEPQAAPANVLTLQLPLSSQEMGRSLQSSSLLLRLSELEQQQPKLRTCRTRLQHHRQEVRRMALHYRRLQRRLEALEAEQLWLQDITTVTAPT